MALIREGFLLLFVSLCKQKDEWKLKYEMTPVVYCIPVVDTQQQVPCTLTVDRARSAHAPWIVPWIINYRGGKRSRGNFPGGLLETLENTGNRPPLLDSSPSSKQCMRIRHFRENYVLSPPPSRYFKPHHVTGFHDSFPSSRGEQG